MATVEMSG